MSDIKKNKYHEKYAGKYTLAFDLGVASVGMAAIDENYEPLIYKNQEVFATKLFSEAHNAENRRLARGVRRGYRRRMRRLQLLQEIFEPIITPIDSKFFHEDVANDKWKNSNNFEDRTLSQVLVEIGINPRTIPTIYHLRKKLICSKEAIDPRLIYLGVHHIMKYRGHFLNSGGISINEENIQLRDIITMLDDSIELSIKDEELVMRVLENNQSTKRDKQAEIKKILKPYFTDNKQLNSLASLLTDSKFSIMQLFPLFEIEEDVKVNISDEDLEEKLSVFETYIYDVVQYFYNFYLNIQLKHILKDNDYFCEAQISLYDDFKEDLKMVKDYLKKEYDKDTYDKFFVTSKSNLKVYSENPNEDLLCLFDRYNKHPMKGEELFKKELSKLLKDDNSKVALSIKLKIDNDDLLVKQRSRRNVAVPYQVNHKELIAILKNQQKYNDTISNDLIKKCEQLLTFRIPYSVGPLHKDGMSEWGWASRKSDTHKRVKPWTYAEVIDERKSSADFIHRMTNNCTYLINETVLPKQSLLVQYFEVYNELNGINYRPKSEVTSKNYRLGNLRHKIVEDLFLSKRTVTKKQLESWYKENDLLLNNHELFGFQKESSFSTSLSSWIDFETILNQKLEFGSKEFQMVEEIILWLTVYNEKSIIKELIEEKFSDVLNESQVKQIIGLNYSGWSRVSERLINGIVSRVANPETILTHMIKDNTVFNEVYFFKPFEFEEQVNKENSYQVSEKIKYEDVEKLTGSPALKRGVWQTIRMYQEVVELFGEPKIIVLENTRTDERRQRTVSREEQWMELSRSQKDKFWEGLPIDYRNDKHFLYLLQEGRCMYTNESLEFSNLNNYHVDHIIPQTLIKDNSLDNRVLVKSMSNMDKSGDKVPLQVVKDRVSALRMWNRLFEKGLISSKKMHNLLREEITDEERTGFIKRQIVETSQIIKHVTNLLQENVEQLEFNTKVYGLRSKIISDVRRVFNLPKIREVGPQHHAMDAYIAAVVQQFIFNTYGDKLYSQRRYSLKASTALSGNDGLIVNSLKKKNNVVNPENGQVVDLKGILESMMEKEVLLTRMTGTNKDGARFWKESRVSPKNASDKNKKVFSNAKDEKKKYGYPKEVNNDGVILVSYTTDKGKMAKRLFSVPVDLSYIYKNNAIKLAEEIFERENVKHTEIKNSKIIRKDKVIQTQTGLVTLTSEKEYANFSQFVPSLTLQRRMSDVIRRKLEGENEEQKLIERFTDEYFEFFKDNDILLTKSIHCLEDLNDFLIAVMKVNYDIDVPTSIQTINELLLAGQPSNSSSSKLKRLGRISRRLNVEESRILHQSVTGLNKSFEDM